MLSKFIADETGATATEYGLIAALFGVTMITAFVILRGEYISMFEGIENGVRTANAP